MERSFVVSPDIVIANGGLNSGVVLYPAFADAMRFTFFSLIAGDATKTYKIQVSHDNGVTWFDWKDGLNVYPAPLPGNATTYEQPSCSALRIVASLAVASVTTFKMIKSVIN